MVKANTRDVLSEGIANDFINKFANDLNNAFIKERQFKKRIDNKGNIKKYLEYSYSIFQKISIHLSVSGSSRNPNIYFIYIDPSELGKKIFGREDRGFVFNSVYFPVRQRGRDSLSTVKSFFPCAISKHAIGRVIFREGLKNEVHRNNYEKFLKQFELIPIAVSFFGFLFFLMHEYSSLEIEGLSIVLPSPNGLFLGEMKAITSANVFIIKTYVDKEIFRGEEQLIVQKQLKKIFQEMQSIPNSIFLHNNLNVINYDQDMRSNQIVVHIHYFFKKLMAIKKDLLYLMARKDDSFDNVLFYKMDIRS